MFRSRRYKIHYILFLLIILIINFGYAILTSQLTINGKSTLEKNTWDVHFENIQVNDKSVGVNISPSISNDTSIPNFDIVLNKPGDFYEFTVDVVNNGSIDAMIGSVIKNPVLTIEQKKYLNYIIEYENGEQIKLNQLLKSNELSRIKVILEYKKDLNIEDLPNASDTVTLGFRFDYIQADDTSVEVFNNGMIKLIDIISGDGTNVGDEVCISEECFYVMYSDEESITMLSKYNLYVGGEYNSSWVEYGSEATGIQESTMIAYGTTPRRGTIKFSNSNYWPSIVTSYPSYVYNENSLVYNYVENYKAYLLSLNVEPIQARLITLEELENLGCNKTNSNCNNALPFVFSTSYWSGTANSSGYVWRVNNNASFNYNSYSNNNSFGVRPVIVLSKEYF